ncbi:MAG TPA: hypothetical protein PKW56_05400 [Clostridiales bacterium]|nr:hypothetical protein [Clostridiales bacterium]
MRYLTGIFIICIFASVFPGEFDLFEERREADESVFRDHKSNKLCASYTLFPADIKNGSVEFTHYFGKKAGFFIESAYSESGSSFKEKADITAGIAYRFTKRARTWIFTGGLGFSANDDVEDYDKISKGFRLNHLTGKFNAEYIFSFDVGVFYSMKARMPLEFDLDEDVSPMHAVGIIFQF